MAASRPSRDVGRGVVGEVGDRRRRRSRGSRRSARPCGRRPGQDLEALDATTPAARLEGPRAPQALRTDREVGRRHGPAQHVGRGSRPARAWHTDLGRRRGRRRRRRAAPAGGPSEDASAGSCRERGSASTAVRRRRPVPASRTSLGAPSSGPTATHDGVAADLGELVPRRRGRAPHTQQGQRTLRNRAPATRAGGRAPARPAPRVRSDRPRAAATRTGVRARRVEVRRPPSSTARSPTTAPGTDLGHRLAVDLHRQHAVEQQVQLRPPLSLGR